ncbi:MAG: bacteriohemerythrin [Desulfuromonadaceae bacterium]
MSFMQWQSTYILGINEFDDHHKHLVGLINTLHDSIKGESKREVLDAVAVELVEYAVYHFSAEEYWMEQHNYHGLAAHHAEHSAFTKQITEFQKAFQSGTVDITLDVLSYLVGWLGNHILVSDAQYANFAGQLSVAETQ